MRLFAAIVILVQLIGPARAQSDVVEPRTEQIAVNAEQAFAQLTRLVGNWHSADNSQSPLRIRFYLTAGETVLVESWEARGKPHSLTLYHLDGNRLLATHYCPQGNQPRLEMTRGRSSKLHFTLRDITDLDPASESHQHNFSFDLSDPDHPVRSETYASKAGVGTEERLRLVSADNDRPSPSR